MKSILLKIDDALFEELEDSIKEVKVSKTAFIKDAITVATKAIQRKKLERQLAKEVAIIKADKEGLAEIRMWQESSLVDLDKYLEDEGGY